MERAIRLRKECPEFGCGAWQILTTNHSSVFAHQCEWNGGIVVAVHNLAEAACTVTLTLKGMDGKSFIALFDDQPDETIAGSTHEVPLASYGYRWFRLSDQPL